ncbi:hypothetical protein JYG23_06095 [Sedimentibacter sp. zth1]|uniref:hypothetical protein n=1 Tax=Sedimentibacter sp. zth1 TaxID=2816908 RepID=UPI001A9218F4|nr:hypothetical protein [Sedimentibacter sp. zth1]QSX06957.1 hypothetical protein JYG23_06095 [Sedimentibacter sp. zth1]
MDSSLEIIKILYENDCQRIVECKDKKTEEIYIYNTIINQNLIKLIDINTLNNLDSNIERTYKTEDRLYIVSKPHSLKNQTMIKEYIDNKDLTLKQQFLITEQLINLFINIYNTSDLLQFKILNINNLSVTEDNKLIFNGYFEFKDEYDLSDNFTYKNLGNLIHYLFSKEEVVDYNISDSIPPDILKIIVKCLTRDYFHPKDILKELINSPVYGMIYCKIEGPSTIAKLADINSLENENITCNQIINDNPVKGTVLDNENTNIEKNVDNQLHNQNNEDNSSSKEKEIGEIEEDVSNQNIIDIYLNNSNKADDKKEEIVNHNNRNKALKIIVPICIVAVLVLSFFIINSLYNKDEPTLGQDTQGENTGIDNNEDNKDDDSSNEDDSNNSQTNDDSDQSDSTQQNGDFSGEFSDFLSKDILQSINYTGPYAKESTDNYNEGNASLVVENSTESNINSLFAVIDFKNEKYRLMQNNQVVISAMFKAQKDVEAKLVVEVYKDGVRVDSKSGKIQIYDDVWSVKTATVITGDVDRINLYIEYIGNNKIWVDSIKVDVEK